MLLLLSTLAASERLGPGAARTPWSRPWSGASPTRIRCSSPRTALPRMLDGVSRSRGRRARAGSAGESGRDVRGPRGGPNGRKEAQEAQRNTGPLCALCVLCGRAPGEEGGMVPTDLGPTAGAVRSPQRGAGGTPAVPGGRPGREDAPAGLPGPLGHRGQALQLAMTSDSCPVPILPTTAKAMGLALGLARVPPQSAAGRPRDRRVRTPHAGTLAPAGYSRHPPLPASRP